jgi:hypothetical protein
VPVLIYVAKHTNTSGELDLGGAGLTAITLFVSGTLIDRTFLKYIGRHCVAILRPAGFSARGNVVIGTGPYFDEGEEGPNKDSCVTKEGLWLVDSAKAAVSQLPNNSKVQHDGKESGIGPEVPRSKWVKLSLISCITGRVDLRRFQMSGKRLPEKGLFLIRRPRSSEI